MYDACVAYGYGWIGLDWSGIGGANHDGFFIFYFLVFLSGEMR